MISLKKTKAEAKPKAFCSDDNPDLYSYGTRISLCSLELEKLGVKELPEIGSETEIRAMVKVVSASKSDSLKNSEMRLELQITSLEANFEDMEENDTDEAGESEKDDEPKSPREKLAKKMEKM